jgi:glycogen(starch) synthase
MRPRKKVCSFMRILMLGWEFPPQMSGGLGRACEGLTAALNALGHHVTFVLPRPVHGNSGTLRAKIVAPLSVEELAARNGGSPAGTSSSLPNSASPESSHSGQPDSEMTRMISVPATFSSPYEAFAPAAVGSVQSMLGALELSDPAAFARLHPGSHRSANLERGGTVSGGVESPWYGSDLIDDAHRYARLAVAMTANETYDVVHAHDWLTFPAGVMLAEISGKPLVVHVHSTEFDRSGTNASDRIVEIERSGIAAATRVLTVSQMTKAVLVRRYNAAPSKVDVVYNGIDPSSRVAQRSGHSVREKNPGEPKTVLFLGRITFQKGPEYFIHAAKRVISEVPQAQFVLAGSGDLALRSMQLANSLGIGNKVFFTGFLGDEQIAQLMEAADCYVMPSVSEPFGIAALEAMTHGLPVIISKTAGISEVLDHALKVDFWDADDIANKIVAVLRYPALAHTLSQQSSEQARQLTWAAAAQTCLESYAAARSS